MTNINRSSSAVVFELLVQVVFGSVILGQFLLISTDVLKNYTASIDNLA
jgi:hypothetical protein